MMSFVSHINRQDWTETYGLNVVVEGTRAPLSTTEIDSYMSRLPKDTSETRKNIIRYALQSVGKVPYYWGGKASARIILATISVPSRSRTTRDVS